MEWRDFDVNIQEADPGIKYTDLSITINTNQRPTSADHVAEMINTFKMFIQSIKTERGVLQELLALRDDEFHIVHVNILPGSFEIGKKPKGGRFHTHFIMEIQHRTHIDLSKLNRAWQNTIYNRTGKRMYVHVKFMQSSREKNYANKYGKRPNAAKRIRNIEMDEAYDPNGFREEETETIEETDPLNINLSDIQRLYG